MLEKRQKRGGEARNLEESEIKDTKTNTRQTGEAGRSVLTADPKRSNKVEALLLKQDIFASTAGAVLPSTP